MSGNNYSHIIPIQQNIYKGREKYKEHMTKTEYKKYDELNKEAQQQATTISNYYNIDAEDLLFNESGSIPIEIRNIIIQEEKKQVMKHLQSKPL